MDEFFTIQSLQAIQSQIADGKKKGLSSVEILANAAVAFLDLYVKDTIAEMQQEEPPAPAPLASQ